MEYGSTLLLYKKKVKKMHKKQHIAIAGLEICLEHRVPGTAVYFSDFADIRSDCAYETSGGPISAVPYAGPVKRLSAAGQEESPAFAEYCLFLAPTADRMLSFDRCIFHGASFSWNGMAYILTAPSGTGKSTQLKNWKALYGDEIRIIDGDKPALRFMEDGRILVYPSPWSGKERWRGDPGKPFPLGGVVCLKQGKEDRIRKLSPDEAVLPVLTQILYTGRTVKDIRTAAACVEKILMTVPVWELVNRGGLPSAAMTREALTAYEEGRKNEIYT